MVLSVIDYCERSLMFNIFIRKINDRDSKQLVATNYLSKPECYTLEAYLEVQNMVVFDSAYCGPVALLRRGLSSLPRGPRVPTLYLLPAGCCYKTLVTCNIALLRVLLTI